MPAQDTARAVADAAPGSRVDRRLLIDGRLVTADKTFPSVDPAALALTKGAQLDEPVNIFSEDLGEKESRRMRHHRETGFAAHDGFLERKALAAPVPGGPA